MSKNLRSAPYEAREDRRVLSLKTRRPRGSSDLAGEHSEDSENPDPVQRWADQLWRDRNAWSIRRHAGMFASHGRLDKRDAPRALKRALAILAEGGEA